MSDQPSFPIPPTAQADETTGRFVVTFADDKVTEGLAALKKTGGVGKLPSAADFAESALDLAQLDAAGGATFPTLGISVVTLDEDALNGMMAIAGEDGAILAIEPERIFYAIGEDGLPITYLRGYKDAVNHLYDRATAGSATDEQGVELVTYVDDAQSTWGLKATSVVGSRWTGRGIKVAVLDTGVDMRHPDLRARLIANQTRSFISGEAVQDGNSHGTHCIGTSCGAKDINGRRYGIASEAAIFVGKVLSNAGSGPTAGILAGMEWAITSGCHVISMSLGNRVAAPSTAYETVGRRALAAGCLIVAAGQSPAGGDGSVPERSDSPPTARPSWLSPRSTISLASPPFPHVQFAWVRTSTSPAGVNVYSSVPMPPLRRDVQQYQHGRARGRIATLYAQAFRVRGARPNSSPPARRLPINARTSVLAWSGPNRRLARTHGVIAAVSTLWTSAQPLDDPVTRSGSGNDVDSSRNQHDS